MRNTCYCAITGMPDTRYLTLVLGTPRGTYFECSKCHRKYDKDGARIDG